MGKKHSPLIKIPNDVRDGLVLDLVFGENAGGNVIDLSGNNNHGVIFGASRVEDPITSKHVLSFDRVDDSVAVSADSSLEVGSAFTLEVFCLPQDAPDNHSYIAGKRNDGDDNFYILQLVFSNDIEFSCGGVTVVGSAALIPYVWNHIFLIKDGSDFFCYSNGDLVASGENDVPFSNVSSFFFGRTGFNDSEFGGSLAFSRIYNRALTPEERKINDIILRKKIGLRPRL